MPTEKLDLSHLPRNLRTAAHHIKAMEEQKLEFDAQDKATRRKTLRSRGLREMERPWRARRGVVAYLHKSLGNMVFHQGARVR